MKNALIGILIVIVVALGVYAINKNKVVAPTNNDNQQGGGQQVAASHCGMTINSPLPGSTVAFPLTINATVDNTQMTSLGCSWGVFEAQAGGVEVKDGSGNVLATAPVTTTANWMTANATPYSASITALSNPNYSGPLTLVFTEDNAEGDPNPDMLTVAVVK